ncbi:unnamed protein product [Brachionus calyciflorus]|uniref:Nuclear pore complex protein Nup153 n=1 Tax=Brachionus calyciflorus TaxID=104777 RepID=A0A813LZI7_9BILA|nr:unnamed protein product [Brachionus calyciflorus]
MENLDILLIPCLLPFKYKELKDLTGNIDCPVCNSHTLNVEECLNSGVNKLAVSQHQIEIDLKKADQLKSESFKDFEVKVNENFNIIKNTIDIRREMLKNELITKIDEYSLNLIAKLELEENEILNSIRKMLATNDNMNIEAFKNSLQNETNVVKKIQLTDSFKFKVTDKINNIKKISNDMNKGKEYRLKFVDLDLNLTETFGELKLGNDNKPKKWECKTCFVYNGHDKLKCVCCQTDRPVIKSEKEPEKKWRCFNCLVTNNSDQSRCLLCNSEPPILENNKDSTSTRVGSDKEKKQSNLFGNFNFFGTNSTFKPVHNSELNNNKTTEEPKTTFYTSTKPNFVSTENENFFFRRPDFGANFGGSFNKPPPTFNFGPSSSNQFGNSFATPNFTFPTPPGSGPQKKTTNKKNQDSRKGSYKVPQERPTGFVSRDVPSYSSDESF